MLAVGLQGRRPRPHNQPLHPHADQAHANAQLRETLRVLLVDDHALTRSGLRSVLTDDPNLTIVGEARTGGESVTAVAGLQPDLVLMDIRLPDMDGLEATRLIRATHPNTPVLILSAFGDADLLVRARRVGAAGYVLKSGSEWQLRVAIWEAVRRDIPCCRSMAVAALQRLAPEQRPDVSANGHLSARELEVLILLAQGKTNVEIADELAITPHTAKAHVDHIFGKLGVKARTHAAVRAVELGLISGRSG